MGAVVAAVVELAVQHRPSFESPGGDEDYCDDDDDDSSSLDDERCDGAAFEAEVAC